MQISDEAFRAAASIMARLRGNGIIHEDFCCERQDEFEAITLSPMIQAAIDAQRERDAKEYIQAGLDAAADAMEADAKLCDCFARSEGECGCGAWSDYKTVPVSRMVDLVRGLDAAAIRSAKP